MQTYPTILLIDRHAMSPHAGHYDMHVLTCEDDLHSVFREHMESGVLGMDDGPLDELIDDHDDWSTMWLDDEIDVVDVIEDAPLSQRMHIDAHDLRDAARTLGWCLPTETRYEWRCPALSDAGELDADTMAEAVAEVQMMTWDAGDELHPEVVVDDVATVEVIETCGDCDGRGYLYGSAIACGTCDGDGYTASESVRINLIGDHAAAQRHVTPYGETLCEPGDHDWTGQGHGGLDENPGVWSAGGTGTRSEEHCRRCGLMRVEMLHGSQRNPGDWDTLTYSMPDDDTLTRWWHKDVWGPSLEQIDAEHERRYGDATGNYSAFAALLTLVERWGRVIAEESRREGASDEWCGLGEQDWDTLTEWHITPSSGVGRILEAAAGDAYRDRLVELDDEETRP